MLRDLRGEAPARPRATAAAAVEALDALVAVGGGHRAVGEAARLQAHPRAGARERGAQRVVVGRGEGRGVDDVDARRRCG